MRILVIVAGLSALLASAGHAIAQSPGQERYEKDEARPAVRPLTPAERVQERASQEARERLSRIEWRHARGISLQRPTLYAGPLHQDLLYVSPWAIYGAYPTSYPYWIP